MTNCRFRIWMGNRFEYWGLKENVDVGLPVSYKPYLETAQERSDQWTGEIDVKGKDIYAGDIVRWQDAGVECTGLVVFHDAWYNIQPIKEEVLFFYNNDKSGQWFRWNKLEVIGNHRENPELMKAK